MKCVIALVLGIALWCTTGVQAQEAIRWGGEWTGGISLVELDGTKDATASTRIRLHARVGSYPWRLVVDGRGTLEGALTTGDEWESEGDLDRLYLRTSFPAADVILGKQAVNWGVGYAWSPTDLFNPPDPLDPSGVRSGVIAGVLQLPVGPLDYWSVAVADEKVGLRRRGNAAGTDWSLLGMIDRERYVVGADATGDLGVGWHAAAAYSWEKRGAPIGLDTVIGADYSWLLGDLTWIGEYTFSVDAVSGEFVNRMTYQQIGYRIDDFTSTTGSFLADLSNGGTIWNAGLSTFLGAQTELVLTVGTTNGNPSSTLAPLPWTQVQAHMRYAF